jgi:hypothetical protein
VVQAPPVAPPAQVYISCGPTDEARARLLADALRAAGLEPWLAAEKVWYGDNWAEMTGQALSQAVAMVAIVSLVTVLDLSEGGALLRFPREAEPVEQFTLAITYGGNTSLLPCVQTQVETSWNGIYVHVRFEPFEAAHEPITRLLSAVRPEFDEYQQFLVGRSNG